MESPPAALRAAPSERRLVVALVAVQVAFGGLPVAAKFVLPHVPPLALALCRLGAGAAALFLLERLFVRAKRPPVRELAFLSFLALLGVVLNQGLFLEGVKRTTATNAILLIATIPAFTLLVAVLLGHERAVGVKVAGLALSFAGVLVLVLKDGIDLGSQAMVGNLLVVANSLSYSFYLVLSRPVLSRHDPLTVVAWVFLLGTLEMALVATPALLAVDWSALGAVEWGAFAYVIVFASVFTYGVNNWVLRHLSASRVASFVYLQPLVGTVLAAVVLREALGIQELVAGALILGGVALANRPASRRAGRPF